VNTYVALAYQVSIPFCKSTLNTPEGSLKLSFRVFNNREDEAKWEKKKHLKAKYQLLVSASNPQGIPRPYKAPSPSPSHQAPMAPPNVCFCCGNPGHWVKVCPNPRPPSKPCLTCGLQGPWKMDCPQSWTPWPLLQPMEPVTFP
jgi:hypothetical protein